VADQAFGRVFGFGFELQDASHAFTDRAGEGLVGAAVLVLQNPGGIFVLIDAAAGDGFYAAVATGGRARAGANVFNGLGRIRGRRGGRGTKENGKAEDEGGPEDFQSGVDHKR